MEIRAYREGILRKWWLIGLMLIISLLIGKYVGDSQTSTYTASATVLLNGPLLANSAVPSNVVQLNTPRSYVALVDPPAVLDLIRRAYPRLSPKVLQTVITVSSDETNQLLTISVTDIHQGSASDIANFLARHFVKTQTADLVRQLDYYEGWLKQDIPRLQSEINQLSLQIQRLTPPPVRGSPPVDPATARTIATDQYKLDHDQAKLSAYHQALSDIQNTRPLFRRAYVILQPATAANVLVTLPPSTSLIELIAAGIGLFTVIVLLVAAEYFHPCIRHKGELQRIVGLPALFEAPQLFSFERKRILRLRPPLLLRRVAPLRLLCAEISAMALKKKRQTVLVTSPGKRRNFADIVATLLAHSGQRTLLVDANFRNPSLHTKVRLVGAADLKSSQGHALPFISKTAHPQLYVLPATASLSQNEPISSAGLIALLPDLESIFNVIVIDAPPLESADTHACATRVAQVLLLVRKRRDSLKTLKKARAVCEQLKLNVQGVLLA